jgi:hypothetical protein
MFTPMPTWARATGVQHKRAIVRAANASATTLNMISPFRSEFQPRQLQARIIPSMSIGKSACRNGSRAWHRFWADDGAFRSWTDWNIKSICMLATATAAIGLILYGCFLQSGKCNEHFSLKSRARIASQAIARQLLRIK